MDNRDKRALAKRLGARIAELRTSLDMTQADLAERLGIGDEHVSRFERGAVLPTLPRLIDIAGTFRFNGLDDFFLGSSPRAEDQATWMTQRIHKLSPAQRAFIQDSVNRLADFFESQPEGKDARG